MISILNAYPNVLLALCVWREADSLTVEAQTGVMWTIFNRAAKPMWWNGNKQFDIPAVILFPKQYSSFNANDPNNSRWPKDGNELTIFEEILRLTQLPGPDPTGDATHYYMGDLVPEWAPKMEHTVDIDGTHFFKMPAAV
jgi:hypothetical protein